jgi:peptidyl-dipeptidase A
MSRTPRAALLSLALLAAGCGGSPQPPVECPPAATQTLPPSKPAAAVAAVTPADAERFVQEVESEILRLWVDRERASWVKATYITYDTELISAKADEAVMEYTARKSTEAKRFDGLTLPAPTRRKLDLLKLSLSLPAPRDPVKRAQLARIANSMEATYGKGKYCSERIKKRCPALLKRRPKSKAIEELCKNVAKGNCLALGEASDILAEVRDYDDQLDVWQGWHAIAPPMRRDFERYVALANEGARELGFANLGDLWKSRYDMSPAAFEAEVDRLWGQVKPLYQDLHCHMRAKLGKLYGEKKVPSGKPIPAHLLGNMWAQEWGNLYELVAPTQEKTPSLDKVLQAKKVDGKKLGARELVRYGEGFFVSLGLDKLPATFWERSMFTKPADRDVVCHASAWDIDFVSDLRLKMCIKINEEDFVTVHHELGHNYYQHYYRGQPALFRDSANDGFHEALGDTVALSVTPPYLTKVGLAQRSQASALNPLMKRALEKIAFLPFGLIIDKYRWDVFAGRIRPDEYNKRWWDLRTRYQGVAPAVARSEKDFDPGAKYHIPANVPYTRYFLATAMQFQFHRALCKIAGHQGPLHACSIYENAEAGRRLAAMMTMGQSRPWPEALKALTGETRMDAGAMVDYFKPLHEWLKSQNKGRTCGW